MRAVSWSPSTLRLISGVTELSGETLISQDSLDPPEKVPVTAEMSYDLGIATAQLAVDCSEGAVAATSTHAPSCACVRPTATHTPRSVPANLMLRYRKRPLPMRTRKRVGQVRTPRTGSI